MVNSADPRKSNNSRTSGWPILDDSTRRRIAKLSMNAIPIVVIDILAEKAMKMPFVEDNHMIE